MPVVVASNDCLTEKLVSNMIEVKARGGRLIVVADRGLRCFCCAHPLTLALQLLTHHVAILNGAEIDPPRNLTKSVTVE